MLTWTSAGAVARPDTLQIRLQRAYPGRVRAGAPVPTRSMPTDEVVSNLRHFAVAGTRGRAVSALVLSGVGAARRDDLGAILAEARRGGVRSVVLHAGVEDVDALERSLLSVDRVVLPLVSDESGATLAAAARALRRAGEVGVSVAANVVLSPSMLPALPAVARVAAAARRAVDAVTFTFPFPVDGSVSAEVPPPARAVAALREVLPVLAEAGVRAAIKGLPACYLGDLRALAGRTANRWYVDADHQLDKALLFFPDVVAFHKGESCRFCAADATCDGFFATYLRRGGVPPLRPLEPTPA